MGRNIGWGRGRRFGRWRNEVGSAGDDEFAEIGAPGSALRALFGGGGGGIFEVGRGERGVGLCDGE
jgi:hypothetical protein